MMHFESSKIWEDFRLSHVASYLPDRASAYVLNIHFWGGIKLLRIQTAEKVECSNGEIMQAAETWFSSTKDGTRSTYQPNRTYRRVRKTTEEKNAWHEEKAGINQRRMVGLSSSRTLLRNETGRREVSKRRQNLILRHRCGKTQPQPTEINGGDVLLLYSTSSTLTWINFAFSKHQKKTHILWLS